jgi:hypothetical protein
MLEQMNVNEGPSKSQIYADLFPAITDAPQRIKGVYRIGYDESDKGYPSSYPKLEI